MPNNNSKGIAHGLIHDWDPGRGVADRHVVELDDETLRDGLQSPEITQPLASRKIELVHLMVDLGIQAADIGLPGCGDQHAADVVAVAREIASSHLPISANCAARTLPRDIDPIIAAADASGIAIEASLFIGSSPIRRYVENWTLSRMLDTTETAVLYAINHGLSVMFVTEDTSRAAPEELRRLYSTAIAAGARRICLADTVGAATPAATRALIRFAKEIVAESGHDVKIDWHGHNDRGLALANALAAIEAGADRIHGTALGIGERCGNVAMEVLLVNLKLLGYIDNDLRKLIDYCGCVAEACGHPTPRNHPAVGDDAFRTSTGVHASAVIKALRRGDEALADLVYSSVPAGWVGRKQDIEVGPMSGSSNVAWWLATHGHETDPELVDRILSVAKASAHTLTTEELEAATRNRTR